MLQSLFLLLALSSTEPRSQYVPVRIMVPEWKLGFETSSTYKVEPPKNVTATVATLLTLRDPVRSAKVELYLRPGTPEAVAKDMYLDLCGKELKCKPLMMVVRSGDSDATAEFSATTLGRKAQQVVVFVKKHALGRGSLVIVGTWDLPKTDPALSVLDCVLSVAQIADTTVFGEVVANKDLRFAAMAPDPSWDWLLANPPRVMQFEDTGLTAARIMVFAEKKTQSQEQVFVVKGDDSPDVLLRKHQDAVKQLESRLEPLLDESKALIVRTEGDVVALAFKRVGPLTVMVIGRWPEKFHRISLNGFKLFMSCGLGLLPTEEEKKQ